MMTRRSALKTSLAATAAMATTRLHSVLAAAPAADPARFTYPYTLPPLPYAAEALEAAIDARTMGIHHGAHHKTYVDGLNKALAATPVDIQQTPLETLLADLSRVPESARTAVRNHGGGHHNHSLFWEMLAPGGGAPSGDLALALDRDLGGLDAFRSAFSDAAKKVFGSGWAWLAAERGTGRLAVLSTPNQDSPLSQGLVPVLGLDVWEHAYYLRYQYRRADYIEAFWKVVNWPHCATRHALAKGA